MNPDRSPAQAKTHADAPEGELPPRPTRRAFVEIPLAGFVAFDTLLLFLAGRTFPSAVAFALLTGALVGWFLLRRFRGVVEQWEREVRAAASRSGAAAESPPTRSTRPPTGSWSNPSRTQVLRQKWEWFTETFRRPRR